MSISTLNVKTDDSGRIESRPAAAMAGAVMYYSGPAFIMASTTESHVNWDKVNVEPPFNPTSRGWATVTLWDINGVTTTVEEDAAWTMVDLTITKDIELVGGALAVPTILPAGDENSEWRVWAYAAPKIPFFAGGQIPFVEDLTISDFYEGEDIIIDGRTSKLMKYNDITSVQAVADAFGTALNSGWYENTIRFIFRHPTGLKPSTVPSDKAHFQIILDSYIKW